MWKLLEKPSGRRLPEAAVKNWVKEQLGSVLRQKGIRNSKDRFTPGGKRRSFAELHNPYTLENLVAAMNAQNARGGCVGSVSCNADVNYDRRV